MNEVHSKISNNVEDDENQNECRVKDRFIIGNKIGAGSFGEIYHGIDSKTGKEVAVKFESVKIRRP